MINLEAILNNPLANKISNIADFANFASTILNTYLIQPQENEGDFGIGGFLFDIRGQESLQLHSDITDHYVENNSAMQDHIALKPETFTVSGFVGELKNTPPQGMTDISKEVEKLQTLGPFLPQLTSAAQAVYNEVEREYRIYRKANETANNVWDKYNKVVIAQTMTEQQKAFNYFYIGWQKRQLYKVQTPWTVLKDMAIQDVMPEQDESTKDVTNFTITFKKIRIAKNIASTKTKIQGRTAQQVQPQTDKGVKKPLQSTLDKLFMSAVEAAG
jgi:hypothetical protein